LKKYAAHFFNHAFGVTEPKEAPYAGTGRRAEFMMVELAVGSLQLAVCSWQFAVRKAG
jgi:hypothetical protein